MSLLHSTPTKSANSTISGDPFHRDFVEWREDLWERSEMLIDARNDWINWDDLQSNTHLVLNQNIGKSTSKQRFLNAVRQVGRSLGVSKMKRRFKWWKELAAHQKPEVTEQKALVKPQKLLDYSTECTQLSYFSVDDADI